MRSARLAKLSWLFAALTFAQVASLPAARAADDSVIARVANYRGADRTDILVKGAREEGKLNFYSSMLQDAAMRTQVIVATHSPHIVAKLEPEQVIVTEKLDGETRLTQLKTPDLKNFLKDFSLAELWLSGEIGGRP